MSNYFAYVHLVSPNTNKPLSNKSPRHRREHPLLLFWLVLEILANLVNKNLKQDASTYMFISSSLCYHTLCIFRVQRLLKFCKEGFGIHNLHLSKSIILNISRYQTICTSLNSREILEGILKIICPQADSTINHSCS